MLKGYIKGCCEDVDDLCVFKYEFECVLTNMFQVRHLILRLTYLPAAV